MNKVSLQKKVISKILTTNIIKFTEKNVLQIKDFYDENEPMTVVVTMRINVIN